MSLLLLMTKERLGTSKDESCLEEVRLWWDTGRYAETGLTGSDGFLGGKYCGGEVTFNAGLSGLSWYGVWS